MEFSERTLQEWQEGFAKLYEGPDSKRDPEHFWIGVMAHFSAVGESIRQYDFLKIYRTAAHAYCWLLCFANKLQKSEDPLFLVNEPIWRLVGYKYPKICGHCLNSSCKCSPYDVEGKLDKVFKYGKWLENLEPISEEIKMWTIKNWMGMFQEVYGKNTELRPLDSIGFHLLEEGGEAAKAIRVLTQFRGVENISKLGIDHDFFKKISNLRGMVELYDKLSEELKGKKGFTSNKQLREFVKPFLTNVDVIKWRIVDSKLNLVSEFCDSFSWLCTLLVKCERISELLALKNTKDRIKWDVEYLLCDIYFSNSSDENLKCYACKKDKCKCLIFSKND